MLVCAGGLGRWAPCCPRLRLDRVSGGVGGRATYDVLIPLSSCLMAEGTGRDRRLRRRSPACSGPAWGLPRSVSREPPRCPPGQRASSAAGSGRLRGDSKALCGSHLPLLVSWQSLEDGTAPSPSEDELVRGRQAAQLWSEDRQAPHPAPRGSIRSVTLSRAEGSHALLPGPGLAPSGGGRGFSPLLSPESSPRCKPLPRQTPGGLQPKARRES